MKRMNMGFVNRMRRCGGGRCIGACAGEEARGAARFVAAREQSADERRASQREIAERIDEEAGHFGKMLTAPEAREAFQAFFEKRKPDFSRFE